MYPNAREGLTYLEYTVRELVLWISPKDWWWQMDSYWELRGVALRLMSGQTTAVYAWDNQQGPGCAQGRSTKESLPQKVSMRKSAETMLGKSFNKTQCQVCSLVLILAKPWYKSHMMNPLRCAARWVFRTVPSLWIETIKAKVQGGTPFLPPHLPHEPSALPSCYRALSSISQEVI